MQVEHSKNGLVSRVSLLKKQNPTVNTWYGQPHSKVDQKGDEELNTSQKLCTHPELVEY